jgi:hypothetical protein
MSDGVLATGLPVGLLLGAVAFVYLLSRSKGEDPKLTLLESLIRVGSEERSDFRQRPA